MTTNSFFIQDLGDRLVQQGYQPLPIKPGEKVPRLKGWSTITIDQDQIAQWAGNGYARHYVGLRTGCEIGLDVDIDDPEVTAFVRADAELMLGDAPARFGRPGRVLLLYRCAERGQKKSVKLLDRQGREHGIETLQHGQQFVAYGIHPGTGEPYRWEGGDPLTVASSSLVELSDTEIAEWLKSVTTRICETFGWQVADSQVLDPDERFLMTWRPPPDPASADPQEWVNARALQAFDRWVPEIFPSATPYQGGYRVSSEALGRDLQEDLAFHPQGIRDHGEERGLTAIQAVAQWGTDGDASAALRWLAQRLDIDLTLQAEKAQEAAAKAAPAHRWVERLEAAQDPERLKRVAAGVGRDTTLMEVDREQLAAVFQRRFKALTGSAVSIKAARSAVRRTTPKGGGGRQEQPEWLQGWYYVTQRDQFYRYASDQWVTAQGFNALFGRLMPPDDDGRRPSAVRMALDEFEMPVVELGMYCPQFGERFVAGARECVNTFNPASVPEAVDWLDADDQAAVEVIDRHLWHLAGGRQAVYRGLLDFLAYCVQQPGRKIRYAVLIKGIEGDGKTLLLELIAACIGEPNVRMVGPAVVMGNFNGFAEGRCVVGLEEVRMVGHNRYDALNTLKPLITNNTIDIHRKGVDSYNVLNVTNYLAFTNFSDAVPITSTDRRWFVIFTPWADAQGMEAVLGERMDNYFTRVYAALRRPEALRRWLLDVKLSDAFDPNGHAPRTPEKDSMRAADVDDDEQLVLQRIERGGPGIAQRAVATDCLATATTGEEFAAGYVAEIPKGRALAKALQRLGWTHYPKVIKWRGKTRRIWVRGLTLDDNEAVRRELDTTLGEDGEETIPF